jgi:hypothetical protein
MGVEDVTDEVLAVVAKLAHQAAVEAHADQGVAIWRALCQAVGAQWMTPSAVLKVYRPALYARLDRIWQIERIGRYEG